jgi:hypothetical protein
MGACGLMILLAGMVTDTLAVVAIGIVLVLVQVDRWRTADREQNNERAE